MLAGALLLLPGPIAPLQDSARPITPADVRAFAEEDVYRDPARDGAERAAGESLFRDR